METEPNGYGILPAMVRLFASTRPHAEGDEFETCAVDHRSLRRQASGAAELHRPPSENNSLQEDFARKSPAAEAIRQGALQRPGRPARAEVRHGTILRTSARAIPAALTEARP